MLACPSVIDIKHDNMIIDYANDPMFDWYWLIIIVSCYDIFDLWW